MAKNTSVTAMIEDPEIAAAERALAEAERQRIEAYKRADDPGEKIGQATWSRLPLPEPVATALKSDAIWKVLTAQRALDKARRPRVPIGEARARLVEAEQHLAAALSRRASLVRDSESDDRILKRAARRELPEVTEAVEDAEQAVEVAKLTLKDSEERERARRRPEFESRARALAQRLDQKLSDPEIVSIIDEMAELAEESQAAGDRVDAIFPGLLPERIEFWRDRQRRAGRL